MAIVQIKALNCKKFNQGYKASADGGNDTALDATAGGYVHCWKRDTKYVFRAVGGGTAGGTLKVLKGNDEVYGGIADLEFAIAKDEVFYFQLESAPYINVETNNIYFTGANINVAVIELP